VGKGNAGDPRHPGVLSRRFRARLREVGLDGFDSERVSPHGLRHSFVSSLINEAGMRAEDVQRLAGHALLVTTQQYRSEDEELAAAAAEALDAMLDTP
jgi:integrase